MPTGIYRQMEYPSKVPNWHFGRLKYFKDSQKPPAGIKVLLAARDLYPHLFSLLKTASSLAYPDISFLKV
ncbi:MAG: hypothetical protein JWP78_2217 [Mucilaginibacter sp.]|nr:hypothetical protein [Mucilaginibacter sp.]